MELRAVFGEEVDMLRAFVEKNGHHNWQKLPFLAGLARSGKSCRLRWMNYLELTSCTLWSPTEVIEHKGFVKICGASTIYTKDSLNTYSVQRNDKNFWHTH